MTLDTVGVRIRALRVRKYGKKHGGMAKFARDTGIDATLLKRYEGGVEPKASKLAAVVKATGCNARWLLTGEGPMFGEDPLMAPEAQVPYGPADYPSMPTKEFLLARLHALASFVEKTLPDNGSRPTKKTKAG